MAKKTTTRSKTVPKAEAAPAAKPRAAAKTAKAAKPKSNKTVAQVKAAPTSVSPAAEPTDDEIRVRAYHRHLERGGQHGTEFEDWLEARRDLMKR